MLRSSTLDDDVDADCQLEDKKERGSAEFMNMEGDGILDSMYEVLWTQQDKEAIDMIVPDTVTFKFNKPTNWYFTKVSSKTKRVRLHKKKPSAIRVSAILKHFQRTCAACCSDIAAYYISQPESTGGCCIYYLTRDELSHFLLHKRNKNGILQGFVDPKPTTSNTYHNSLIRCSWSQSVCLVERRVNVHLLTSAKASRYHNFL
ncbi:hypothetical protein DIPPA_16640 [Diplonema papillatum]|nr:hypothetical protein DIPPA_16640 [Diplonema papillatum]